MRKITLCAVAAALLLAGVGGWVASTTQARVIAPTGFRIAPLEMMMKQTNLPTEEFVDYSLMFN
jgi:hypothetical protein